MSQGQDHNRQGRVLSLVIVGVALFWMGATALGSQMGWSQRTRALFDLAALAGFVWALWMGFALWRARNK
ncbi:MAG: DUF5337 domain-containing protein [Pelagimonas sp.]|jgi:threonine/homoserine/homoserine lactone efflux protein|nr:DUF5337 domain-containing protein [Pelagimonas sp.]